MRAPGRKTSIVAAAVLLLGISSTALAGRGKGGVFNLGVVNSVSGYVTTLTGTIAGRMLQVTNGSTATSASAIGADSKSPSAATINASNTGGGPALRVSVSTGKAPMRVSSGAGKVANLDADKLDGKDSAAFQNRVGSTCAAGSSIRAIGSAGTVTCEADDNSGGDITRVTAGMGLTGGGASGDTSLSVDTGVVQARVRGSCDVGSSVRAVNADGTVVCEEDGDSGGDITAVTAGNGLSGGATNGDASLSVDTSVVQDRVSDSCPAGSSIRAVNQDGTVACETDNDSAHYVRTVVVSPVGGNTRNGAVLLAALAGITGAAIDNPYLLKIEPGVYDLGTQSLVMKPYVDIEGSGELRTTVTRTGSFSSKVGTVVGANDAELRLLTVVNTGGAHTMPIAIYNGNASPRLTQVTATASGGSRTYGVFNDASSPTMTNVTVTASGAAQGNQAVFNGSSSPIIRGGVMKAGGVVSYGLYSSGAGAVKVSNSAIEGETRSILNSETSTRVAASEMSGGPAVNYSGLTCAGVYDENNTFYANTCP